MKKLSHRQPLVILLLAFAVAISSAGARSRFQKDYETEHRVFGMLADADRLIDNDKYMEAKQILQNAAALDPTSNSGIVHQRLAKVYNHFGSYQKAIVEGLISLKFDGGLRSSALEIALAYKELGKCDEAKAWAEKYLEMKPDKVWRQKAEDLIKDIEAQKERQSKHDPHSPDYLDEFAESDGAHPWARQKLPIKVFISDGAGVPGFQPSFPPRVIEALNTWVHASNGKIAYQLTSNANDADLLIAWTNEPLKPDEKQKFMETAGLTHYPGVTNDSDWRILKATIDVKTTNVGEKRYVSDQEVKAVVLHELGHAFGLTGHSTNVNDIMYYSESSRNLAALSKRDRATIARLYADYPQLVNVQDQPPSSAFATASPTPSTPAYAPASRPGYQPYPYAPPPPAYAQQYPPAQAPYAPPGTNPYYAQH